MPKRIAIIGAGVSGLAAAVELLTSEQSDKLSITIYESRREAGGRTRSFTDSLSGDELDNGQHLLMGCYTSTIEYLEKIGTSHLLKRKKGLSIPFFSSKKKDGFSLKLPTFLPTPVHLFVGILQSDLLAVHDKLAALRLGIDILLFRLDKKSHTMTCAQLFALTKQPETIIHKLWEPIILATMNAPIDKASAQVFINTIRTVFLRDKSYCHLLFPTVGLSALLIDPALELLKAEKVDVKYGTVVQEIQIVNGLAHIYHADDTLPDVYDAVIYSTTSYDSIALPDELEALLPKTEYSPIVNAYLWIDKKILSSNINGFLGTTLQWCFPKSSHYSSQLLACTVSAGEIIVELGNEEIANILWKDIQSVIPDAVHVTLLHSQVIKEKRATILLTPEVQANRPTVATTYKQFYFAGDLAQNGLPMTIEGAIRNGQIAARKLIAKHFGD